MFDLCMLIPLPPPCPLCDPVVLLHILCILSTSISSCLVFILGSQALCTAVSKVRMHFALMLESTCALTNFLVGASVLVIEDISTEDALP